MRYKLRKPKKGRRSQACYGKRRYRDRTEAKIALAQTQSKDAKGDRREKRYYPCGTCKGWHLSSRDER